MIDAAEVSHDSRGDTGSGDYTSVAWVDGVGNGLTITPVKGDTGKTLFLPNAGERTPGSATLHYGIWNLTYSATYINDTTAWALILNDTHTYINQTNKLYAYSLRCVRS